MSESKIWGYILEGPGRPSKKTQLEALVVRGCESANRDTIWCDKLKGRTSTRPATKLEGRNDLLLAVMPGDTVVFAAPQCIGVSEADAGWLLDRLAERNATVLVNGDLHKVEPGESTDELRAAVRRWHKTKNMRAWRAKHS